eukprot:1141508-Pyramimonas_sp.AAC.1
MAQGSFRFLTIALKTLHEAPRAPQDSSKRPKSLPLKPPRSQQHHWNTNKKQHSIIAFSPLRILKWPRGGLSGAS